MIIAYVSFPSEFGGSTDIPVEIVGYVGVSKVRVRSLIGWPFGDGVRSADYPVSKHDQKEKVVDLSEVTVIQND